MDEPPTVRLVWVMLCGRIGDHNRAWPAVSTLCEDTGLGDTAVRGALRRLVDGGHVSVVHRHGLSSLWTIGPRHNGVGASPGDGVGASPRTNHRVASHQSPRRQATPEIDKKLTRKATAADNGNGTGTAAVIQNGPAPGESWGEYRERGGR
jgi:hypothetical protein